MNTIVVAEPRSGQQAARPTGDRRRPGRVDYQNNELIGLLRDPVTAPVDSPAQALPVAADWDGADDDSLSAVRGIATAVILSLGCWTAIGAGIWLVFRG
jgi:hypothetical protein